MFFAKRRKKLALIPAFVPEIPETQEEPVAIDFELDIPENGETENTNNASDNACKETETQGTAVEADTVADEETKDNFAEDNTVAEETSEDEQTEIPEEDDQE